MKSDVESDLLRKSGNEYFNKKSFKQALILYNQSLCFASSTSQKSLAFANRSAVYFEVKRYRLCLENIQLAKDFHYDQNEKLDERKRKCEEITKLDNENEKFKNESVTEQFFTLLNANEKVPYISDSLELKSSEKYGNYLITKNDLKTGDIIVIEDPYIKFIETDFCYERCANCLRHNYYNLIPCETCTKFMYCSETCKSEHEKFVHQFRCSKPSAIAIDVCMQMIMKAVEICGSFKSFFKLINNTKRRSVFDFNEIDEKAMISIVNSCAMSENSDIYISEKMKSIFNVPPFKRLWSTNLDREKLIESFHRQLKILNTNLMELGEHVMEDNFWYAKSVGSGLCAFSSLFNHSCDSNIKRVTLDNKLVFFVGRPIKQGEQLFISYGYSFNRMNRDERHKGLKKYSFQCDCEACAKNYPLIENLPRIDKNFLEPEFDGFDKATAIEKFKENCNFIEKHSSSHPCYETTTLIIHNEHLMYQIAKTEL